MVALFDFLYRAIDRKELGPGVPNTDILAKRALVVTTNESLSRLYALVIGINSYPKLKPLAGAVADAAAIEYFLTDDLRVPSDHIQKLIDGQATRDKIILAFRQLRDDPRIQKGDPILIYFAGHGGLGKASHEWRRRYGYDDIQVIFPYDYGLFIAGCQQIVNCIPDRTIAALLNDLASVKGNNVTVIFDSCHSASANRGETLDKTVPGRIARDPEVQVNISDNIDADILSLSPIKLPESSCSATGLSRHAHLPLYLDQASHVYFAACGSQEKAWEENGRGVFTSALLRCIRANGVDKISYSDLLMSMPLLPKQSPHCYGLHKSRTLFDSQVPSRKVTFIPVKIERGAPILQAGAASGVTQGSVWELHLNPMDNSKNLGRLSAQTPQVASTLLIPLPGEHALDLAKVSEPMTDRLYARQIRSGTAQELRVYFSPEAWRRIFTADNDSRPRELNRMRNHEIGYVAHSARDSADLVVEICHVSLGEPEVTYTLCDAHAQKYGVAQLPKRTRAQRDEVEHILYAAARWYWHLRRTSSSARSASMMSLEMVKLGVRYGDYIFNTDGPLENLNKTGIVDLKAREEDQYGIRLLSQVPAPVYVHVFYFDTTDFSIVPIFGHSRANGWADPEISARGQFTVGDGANGGFPLSFQLNSDEVLDVGYIKVFWSTDPLELDAMVQGSAFDPLESDDASPRKLHVRERGLLNEWGTSLVTLVQRSP